MDPVLHHLFWRELESKAACLSDLGDLDFVFEAAPLEGSR